MSGCASLGPLPRRLAERREVVGGGSVKLSVPSMGEPRGTSGTYTIDNTHDI